MNTPRPMHADPLRLHERLRHTLTDDRLALPAWPDPVGRVRAGINGRRRRWRRLLGVGLATVLALLIPAGIRFAVAPVGDQAQPEPGPSAVPWLDSPANGDLVPTPPPRPTARPCAAADLAAKAVVHDEGAAAGSHFYIVTVANAGTSRCTLGGSASLTATDAKTGERGKLPTDPGNGYGGLDTPGPATVDPGDDAQIGITTGNGCAGGETMTEYRDVTLTVLGRGYPLTGLRLETACVLRLSDWFFRLPEPIQQDPLYPGLAVALDAPPEARAGEPYEFVVAITNPTDRSVALQPCPAYTMGLFKSGGTYRLNCTVLTIPAHGTIRFAMRIAVADWTPPGPTLLTWRLWDVADHGPDASATVDVTGPAATS